MTSSSIASVRRVMPLENPLNHHTKEPNSFNHFLKLVLRWKSSNASRHLTGHALVIFQLSPLLKYFQVDIDNTVNSFSVKKKNKLIVFYLALKCILFCLTAGRNMIASLHRVAFRLKKKTKQNKIAKEVLWRNILDRRRMTRLHWDFVYSFISWAPAKEMGE